MATEETTQTDSAMDKAAQAGWVPKEEWVEQGKNAEEWVDHREFNLRGELMGRISAQTKELKQLRSQTSQYEERVDQLGNALRALGEQNKKLALKRIAEERGELRRIRAEAEAEKDFDTIASIDEDLETLKTSEDELKVEPASGDGDLKPNQEADPQADPENVEIFNNWVKENPWYVSNPAAYNYAEFVAKTIPKEGKSFEDVLNEVADTVTSIFLEEQTDKGKPPSKGMGMEPSPNRGGGRKRGGGYASRLTEEERAFAQVFVQEGAMDSIEDYAKQLYGD